MDFYEVVGQVVELLQRQGRVSYRALKRQFGVDDDFIEDLKEELLYVHESAVQSDDRGFTWTGDTEDIQVTTTSQPDQAEPQPTVQQEQPPQVEPPPEPHTPDAERRQLTILFTDLVDSTKLSGQLDAEDYREVVRAYQATCAEVIARFDCHLAQTLGDGLLVYSGYPVAHDNDAERAVRTGLGILDAMKALNERLEQDKGIRLGVRVGIHTGPVVVGDVGAGSRHEQLALGETPNIAARIQGLAEPDTVVLSAATYRLIEGFFDCEALGEQALRGVAEPIVVHQVLQESGVQSRLDIASARGLTPLVGRESEVALLLERWAQVKDGSGQVVLLSGELGIGKTKIVQTLKEHVADEPHTRWECRSLPYYQNTALYPITDLFQRFFQFQADDTPEQRLKKLAQNLRSYRQPLTETVPLFAPFLSLSIPEDGYPPLNLSPQRQRQKTLETIVAILQELAEHQPVLFILEDLHWTDPTTLDLVAMLIGQTPTASIGVLLTCRPEYQPSWGHRSYLTEVTLSHLSRKQIERLAEHVADGKRLPAEVLEQITEKTDGVPLFVEEMTKAVLETGALKDVDGRYELIGTVASLSIPSTLQDSLMARLDRLVTAKAVAQYAAVIGRRFSYELLQAVSQLDEATLQRELGRLVEAELVYQRGLPPQATYTFKHALVVDAAYESLLKGTRQHYHERIVRVLEAHYPETVETQPELLAHHATEAGLAAEAWGHWYRAGTQAHQRSTYAEAIAHLTKGLEVLATLPETPERARDELSLLGMLRQPIAVTKGYSAPDLEQINTRVRVLCQQVEEPELARSSLSGLWTFYVTHELRTARELAEQALGFAQRVQPSRVGPGNYGALGMTLVFQGDFALALEYTEQALTLYNPELHSPQVTRVQNDPGIACLRDGALAQWHLGYPDQALQKIHKSLSLAQELGHAYSLSWAHNGAAWLYRLRRDHQRAWEQSEAARAIATEQGFALHAAHGIIYDGWRLSEHGQVEAGIIQMSEGLAALASIGSQLQRPSWLGKLAEAYGKIGRLHDGLRILAEALTIVEQTDIRWSEAELYRMKGELLRQQSSDNHTEAESCFHQAIDVAQNQSAKSWELRAATSLAHLWQSQDKRQEAYDLLAPVYEWFTEGFDTADLIDAKALLDELAEGR